MPGSPFSLHSAANNLRAFFSATTLLAVRKRFPYALRAGLCCGLPVMMGYFSGHLSFGLLATIGSFTALYGSDRPYRNRAIYLAVIALILAAIVVAGIVIAANPWAAVITVSLIAAVATFICNAMGIGPPGAYMFALACASGTGMAANGLDPWQSGLWVLCGGAISWLAHMSGMIFDRRGPEKTPSQSMAPVDKDSAPLPLALRVLIATLIAGSIGVLLGLDRAYWGMAAVVVVLNQPYGWPGTTRRAVYRILGTLAGLLLAWLILSLHPQGLWIALTVGLLQFVIEIWVVLQYAVAAMFITANALTIAAGGRGLSELGGLFSARALDTVIGCGVALLVFVLTMPKPRRSSCAGSCSAGD